MMNQKVTLKRKSNHRLKLLKTNQSLKSSNRSLKNRMKK